VTKLSVEQRIARGVLPTLADCRGQPVERVKAWLDMVDQVRRLKPPTPTPPPRQQVEIDLFGNRYRVTGRPTIIADMRPRVEVHRFRKQFGRLYWVVVSGKRRRDVIAAIIKGAPYVET
jgi:hypothetical protein